MNTTGRQLRTLFRKRGIPERDEQVVGKIPDAVSISEEVKESENSFECRNLIVI
jgi:hypothetical protein